jgi:hypothetical protein
MKSERAYRCMDPTGLRTEEPRMFAGVGVRHEIRWLKMLDDADGGSLVENGGVFGAWASL